MRKINALRPLSVLPTLGAALVLMGNGQCGNSTPLQTLESVRSAALAQDEEVLTQLVSDPRALEGVRELLVQAQEEGYRIGVVGAGTELGNAEAISSEEGEALLMSIGAGAYRTGAFGYVGGTCSVLKDGCSNRWERGTADFRLALLKFRSSTRGSVKRDVGFLGTAVVRCENLSFDPRKGRKASCQVTELSLENRR